jgi:LmbE family N-acetylglucosaminyl deacetylase
MQVDEGTVLAIGAHPDDVVLGVGGFLAALAGEGRRVVTLSLTSGELGGDPEQREHEDRLAAMRLGAAPAFARLPDGGVSRQAAFRAIESALAGLRPATVFVHDPRDSHPDHAQAGRAAIAAARAVPNVFFYEGPSSLAFAPQAAVDVHATWSCKLDALRIYDSQRARNLVAWAEGAARFRSWPANPGGVSEAFRVARADFGALLRVPPDAERRGEPLAAGR